MKYSLVAIFLLPVSVLEVGFYIYSRGEVADNDIEPSDSATSPLSIFEGPSVEAAEGPESVSTGLAGPVSALLTLSQWEALPPWAVTAH